MDPFIGWLRRERLREHIFRENIDSRGGVNVDIIRYRSRQHDVMQHKRSAADISLIHAHDVLVAVSPVVMRDHVLLKTTRVTRT